MHSVYGSPFVYATAQFLLLHNRETSLHNNMFNWKKSRRSHTSIEISWLQTQTIRIQFAAKKACDAIVLSHNHITSMEWGSHAAIRWFSQPISFCRYDWESQFETFWWNGYAEWNWLRWRLLIHFCCNLHQKWIWEMNMHFITRLSRVYSFLHWLTMANPSFSATLNEKNALVVVNDSLNGIELEILPKISSKLSNTQKCISIHKGKKQRLPSKTENAKIKMQKAKR